MKSYFKTGLVGFQYKFHDFGIRNLTVSLKNDSILELVNSVTRENAPNALKYQIKCEYFYTMTSLNEIIVGKNIYSNCKLSSNKYNKPYEGNFDSRDGLFFDMTGDTIRFSGNLERIQIREFSFEISR